MDSKLKNKIFDDMMAFALKEEFERQIEEMPTEDELEEYAPSLEFDLKIQALIKNHYKKTIKDYFKLSKKAAAWTGIVVVTGSVGLMSVEASRNYILNTFMEFRKGSALITVENAPGINKKSDIKYMPKFIPEGFSESQTLILGETILIEYENPNTNEIHYSQCLLINAGSISVDTDGTEYSEIKINGNTANLFKAKTDNDLTTLIWTNEEFQFVLSCYGSDILNDFIKMAQSIEQVSE